MLSKKEKILIQSNFFKALNFFQFSKPPEPSKIVLSCVYAFEMSNGTVKIGITKNIQNRIFSIKASSGLNVVNFYHTDFAPHNFMLSVERACQKHFKNNQIQGEFFNITFAEACAELDKYKDKILLALKESEQKFLEELDYFWKLEKVYFELKEKIKTAPKVEKATTKKKYPEVLIETTKKAIIDAGGLMQIFEQEFSIPKDTARLKAVSIMELAYGIDLHELKEPIPPVEKEEEIWLTPKQLGALVGKSAQYVNKRLCDLGLQRKDFKYGYVVTDYGKDLVECSYDNSNGNKRCQIKWFCCLKYLI